MSVDTNGIPFTFLCSLFREISKIKQHGAKAPKKQSKQDPLTLQVFKNWLVALRKNFSPLPAETTTICFRLIFPHEDFKRKYDMQEARLAETLANCYGVSPSKFAQWDNPSASGCLGHEIRCVLEQTNSNDDEYISPLTIHEVDELLDDLASLSGFSDASVRQKHPQYRRRPRIEIIRQLYRGLRPDDAAYLTQIILKDLRPLLYPLSETHFTASLRNFNTKAVVMLTKEDAMRAWDSSGVMLKACRIFSDMDRAAEIFEMPEEQRPSLQPVVGTMIEIPKSRKAQKCRHGLSFLTSSKKVWAEIKYDGERAQIHVEVQSDDLPRITIFSKSKRDSTLDRHGVHKIIREALGFTPKQSNPQIKRSVILDAEMVAFDGERIDEFWRIRRLVEDTAYGVRKGKRRPTSKKDEELQSSMLSDDESDTRHLGLVFFDILSLDSRSMLHQPYQKRRSVLQSLLRLKSGEAILTERFPIDMAPSSNPRATLRSIFAEQIADHQEGLVLKAEESRYNDYRLPWVKVKKDYIPGFGDTLDMVLVGATWEKNRARELRVGPNTYTTFYIGTFKDRFAAKPHLEVFYTASYGLGREQLEELNYLIRSSDCLSYPLPQEKQPENYTFSLLSGIEQPMVILQEPLLVELFGAGFTKSPKSKFYELRFPRMTKFFRHNERDWRDAINLAELHDIARQSVGRDRSDKDIYDLTNELFGHPPSPGVKCPIKRESTVKIWKKRLREMDLDDSDEEDALPEALMLQKRAITNPTYADADTRNNMAALPGSPSPKRRRLTAIASTSNRTYTKLQDRVEKDGIDQQGVPNTTLSPLAAVTNTLPNLSSTMPVTDRGVLPIATPTSSLRPRHNNHSDHSDTPVITSGSSPSRRSVGPLTPSSSTDPLPGQNGKTDKVLASHDELPKRKSTSVFKNAHVWFMNTKSSCKVCSVLRKGIPGERRIHSLESLLTACGCGSNTISTCITQAAIVVDSCGCDNILDNVQALVKHIQSRPSIGQRRIPIFIFSCDPGECDLPMPILQHELH